MKHQTINSLKFKLLATRLRMPTWQAVGILEALWLLAQHDARDGDLTQHGAAGIAAWIGYDGDAEELLAALVGDKEGHGWIDRVDGRLLIHDWQEHCPNWLKGLAASSATKKGTTTNAHASAPSAAPSPALSAAPTAALSPAPSAALSAAPPETLDLKPETLEGENPPTPLTADPPPLKTPKEIQLPSNLDTPEFRDVLAEWRKYRGKGYGGAKLAAAITGASRKAAEVGLPAVIKAFRIAMDNGWTGWNQPSSFAPSRASPSPAGARPNPARPRIKLV